MSSLESRASRLTEVLEKSLPAEGRTVHTGVLVHTRVDEADYLVGLVLRNVPHFWPSNEKPP